MKTLTEAQLNHRLRMATTYLNWLKKQPLFVPHVKNEIKKTKKLITEYSEKI